MENNKHRASSNILATNLGELELQAMEVLWGCPHLDARQIRERLQRTRQPSLSTVQSALERLYRKSFVDRIKQGHAYSYFVTVSRGALLARMLGEAIHLLHDGRMETILSSFVHVAADMDESSLDSLEEMIRNYRRTSGGNDGTPQEGKL
ncbi:BlaI/MecI/CopY family transcriptional regulator [Pseudohongiella sp. O18]|uniref:BlaI/MecI/CopY family transcriptional regulator n=1 Tax=Pseudohongiella sp. O18 TaxID=2904248 RepID=UPI001F3F476A|nr:BlaI/MecI/CopY family transcriptional regulator [Pseudohongiella sp. O18]